MPGNNCIKFCSIEVYFMANKRDLLSSDLKKKQHEADRKLYDSE